MNLNPGFEKYFPFTPQPIEGRTWPDKVITQAPVWCSVDLRDGNQALIDPMDLREKLEYFHTLVDIGVKEIEVGFPSASEVEYEFLRTLIDGGHVRFSMGWGLKGMYFLYIFMRDIVVFLLALCVRNKRNVPDLL